MIRLIMWLTLGPTGGKSQVDDTSWESVDAFADSPVAAVPRRAVPVAAG